jgi:pimeloyl-ACP methyl ester carboxylesterase
MYAGAFPETIVDRFIEGFARPGRLTAALSYYRSALPELAPAMREVTTPAILIWGDRDTALGRRQAETTGELVSGAYELHVLEGAGHWLQHERPDEISRHLLAHSQGASGG